jgi:glycosyltransferase involved in cell wall biosynthesis
MVDHNGEADDIHNKWLILTQYYAPEIGAPQIRLGCFARQLKRQGKMVSVTTAMPSYPRGRVFAEYRGRVRCKEQIDGVDVQRVWAYAANGRAPLLRLLNYCSFAMNVLPIVMLGTKPDVIFVEAQPLPLGVVALFMKLIRNVPYVYNVPDLQVEVAKELGFLRGKWLLAIAQALENLLLKHAWKVSTVTQSFMVQLEARGVPPERITFLPNGADTEFLTPTASNAALLRSWNIEGKKAFVYVGTHAYYHGLDTLINAAELLKDENGIRYVMIGDGPERARIQQLAMSKKLKNITFAQIPYRGTNDLYSVAYASIATLRNIPVAQGMRLSKVFPALSCAVPVIYSGQGEAAELLNANRCGLTTAPEDAPALARAVKALADNPSLRNQLGSNGRLLVEHDYSWTTIVNRWLLTIGNPDVSSPELASDGAMKKPALAASHEGLTQATKYPAQIGIER